MSQLVLLAPPESKPTFGKHVRDDARHAHLLGQACRLRGQAYVSDGAIPESDLNDRGEFYLPIDDQSWHILIVGDHSEVVSAVRLTELPLSIRARRGRIPHIRSSLSRSSDHIDRLWEAERFLAFSAVRSGRSRPNFFVASGWASREAQGAEVALAAWALTRRSNCSSALAIASERHDAYRQLMRTGAKPIRPASEGTLYYDPHYGCKVALLGFMVFNEADRLKRIVTRMADGLDSTPVVMRESPLV